ncbi:dihydrofolate reductase [Lacticigenium naphthae]|uniref:dihydrofolate reductase n=1 Tax=Lacticigenium naphthae TaxID=515351 RepID=UPI000425DD19|nr:dihydrofolate reductase [Lacticigenium naphthae]
MITFVYAEDENGVIGQDGSIPWHLPSDMKFFKKVTLTGNVVMGRKTYESIPNPPLAKRENIILTRNLSADYPGAEVMHSREEVIAYANKNEKETHVIGGADIFRLFRDDVDKLYRTVIHHSFAGDTYMPKINYDEWDLVKKSEGVVDEKNRYPHTFYIYERKQK